MHGQRITLVKAKNNIVPNLPLPNPPPPLARPLAQTLKLILVVG
jgi:hypothetical protein